MRVTSEQVDDMLHNEAYSPTVMDICRDWLDMAAVVQAAQEYVAFCETDEIGTTTLEGGLLLHALCNALAALTTGGDS